MKKRNWMGLLLAAALTAEGGFCSLADETAARTITITNERGASENHIYEAYRIFSGDYTEKADTETGETEKILTDIGWDPDFDSSGLLGLMEADSTFSGKLSAVEREADGSISAGAIAEILSALSAEEVMTFARLAEQCLPDTDDGHAVLDAGENETEISVTGDGYYLVKDQDASMAGAELDAATFFLLTVAGDAEVRTKSDWPSITKKIVDTGTSHNGEATDLVDTNEAAVGDRVTYELNATVPSMVGYESYIYRIHDRLSDGLTFDADSVKVYLDNDGDFLTAGTSVDENGEIVYEQKEITAEAQISTEGLSDGCAFEVDFPDFIDHAEDAGKHVIVRFQAELNEDAVVGTEGNPNTVHLEFSNYPGKESTGTTPEDTVITYVSGLDLLKLDAKNTAKALQGAEFVLYMLDENGGKTAGRINRVKENEEEGYFEFEFTESGDGTYDTHSFVTGDDGQIHIRGLRAGTYLLEEINPPAGYNALHSPITLELSWEGEDEVADGTEKAVWRSSISGDGVESARNVTAEGGIAALRVLNSKGIILPVTGGAGTTALYSGGILLMLFLLFRINRRKPGKRASR